MQRTRRNTSRRFDPRGEGLSALKGPGIVAGLVLLIPVLISLVMFWYKGLGFLAAWESLIRGGGPLLLALVVIVIGGFIVFVRLEDDSPPLFGGVLAVIGFLLLLYSVIFHGYVVNHTYAQDVENSEQVPSYADRAPWNVADAYAQRDQGDVIGDRLGVHYVPQSSDVRAEDGEGTSRYTTLIQARAPLNLAGYEAIQTMSMPVTGQIPGGVSEYCSFDEDHDNRLNALWPWHSLSWSIHAERPFAHWDSDDAYGYCDGDTPVVVVPLWEYDGWFVVTKSPDGAAIYRDGETTILSGEELVEENIQGPTYPRSIAEQQRSAINAGGSLADYWGSRYGYDTTSKDVEDANEGNSTEFTLIDPDGALQYVTPLSPRGSSQSITALASVPAQQTTDDGRGPVMVNTWPDLPSTSTIVTTIKESSVQGDNQWTTRWSAGMYVYEILPAQDGHWAASIGQGQAVSYRADITPDGVVTVVGAEAPEETEERESVTLDGGVPLSEMTEQELVDLILEATTLLEDRLVPQDN